MTNSSPPMRATVSPGRTESREAARNLHEHRVAHVVTELVVDRLEPVEVDVGDHQRTPAAVEPRHRVRQTVAQQHPVGDAGERVVQRSVREVELLGGVDAVDDDAAHARILDRG